MKKITKIFLGIGLLLSAATQAQCLDAIEGQYPSATSTATTCDGLTATVVTTAGWASEYSLVNVTAGETYTFRSSVATDYITISSDDGATAAAFGTTPVVWVADVTGPIRFYTHLDDQCGGEQVSRTRSYVCGIPPCVSSTVAFSTERDCDNSTFTILADVSSLGSAATLTVSDDQSSPTQSVNAPGVVTFGPYSFGTTVTLSVANDDNSLCTVTSDPLVIFACPMANDDCSNAVTLNCGDALTNQTTEGATGGTSTSCVGTIGDDVWYTFTGNGQIYTLTATSGNGEGPQVEVYESTDGTCSGFAAGTCIAAAGSGETTVTLDVHTTDTTVYYVHVGSWINGDPAVIFDLSLTCADAPPAPANDDCANAISLACGDTLTGQTTNGATGGTGTSCVGTIGDDVWYTFNGDGQIFTLTATATGAEGPQLEVYESTDGTCGGFTPGTCYAAAGTGETAVTLTFNTTSGSVYFAHVGSWINGDPAVDFDLSLTCQAPPTAPDNDECSGAYVVTVNPDLSCGSVTSGTVFGATASSVDATACGGTEDDDVWFSFVATDTRHQISLTNVTGSTTDMFHSLWEGDCAGLTLVAGSCSDADTSAPSGLTIGNTYYIRVYTSGSTALADTTFDVCVGTLPPPPANDDCSGAESITVGTAFADFAVVGTTASASTVSGLTYNCQTNRKNDVWYSFTVPASGSVTVETDTSAGTSVTDTVLSVFTGTCGSLTEVGCDDDTGNGNFSITNVTGLTPGDTVYVGVWTWGTSADGEFQVSVYDPTAATSSFDNANFTYYPNPVDTVLNLNYVKNISSVSVFNLVGQEVMAKTSNNLTQIDMSHLASGTYLVKVTSDNQVKTIKINKR
ncbi:MAG: T9SS type A sorting domain-containing protein [Flavobacteriaceae bacterium]